MSVFELTARHQMCLGDNNIIPKGERLRLNIHTMGVQPYNMFSNPENRRQAIQQLLLQQLHKMPRFECPRKIETMLLET